MYVYIKCMKVLTTAFTIYSYADFACVRVNEPDPDSLVT